MLQLAYMSASTPMSPDVFTLSKQASPRNFAEEITGILLHRNGHFLHIIEGPKEYVEDLFLRIIGDYRHQNLNLLFRKIVTGRQYGTSSMMTPRDRNYQNETIRVVKRSMTCAAHDIKISFESIFGPAI